MQSAAGHHTADLQHVPGAALDGTRRPPNERPLPGDLVDSKGGDAKV